jgi:hypothetical protein
MNNPDRLFFSVTTGYAVARLAFAFADTAVAKIQAFTERIHPMRKTYGPEQVRVIPEIPFDLNVEHELEDGSRELQKHNFIGKPDPSSGDFARFSLATQGQGAEIVEALMSILPRMIDNSDGVSATWEYRELENVAPTGVQTAGGELGQVVEDEPEKRFYGPDGQLYPASEREKFTAFEAGSSRRRLYHLLFVDPDARVQIQTVVEIMKDLFAEGAGRPTSA